MNNEALDRLKKFCEEWKAMPRNDNCVYMLHGEDHERHAKLLISDIEALTPEVDLDAIKQQAIYALDREVQLGCSPNGMIEYTIDHLSKRGLLRGDVRIDSTNDCEVFTPGCGCNFCFTKERVDQIKAARGE